MRSIVIAAALSCVCLPGQGPIESPATDFPVSNLGTKSSRLGFDKVNRFQDATYRLASADPAMPMPEQPRIDMLANVEVAFVAPDLLDPAEADAAERAIDRIAIVPRIPADPDLAPPVSRDQLCESLANAAEEHEIPLVFFNNLIWQESRFRTRAISHVGAQGVAQFMPGTASSVGLSNPFNAIEALPASAKLLRDLHEQFGNLGLAAAAYNAGPGRVASWLSKRSGLPAETRDYVKKITGRPAEHWRTSTPPTVAFRLPAQAPCRINTAFVQADEDGRELQAALELAALEKARAAKLKRTRKPRTPTALAKATPAKTGEARVANVSTIAKNAATSPLSKPDAVAPKNALKKGIVANAGKPVAAAAKKRPVPQAVRQARVAPAKSAARKGSSKAAAASAAKPGPKASIVRTASR